MGRRPTSWHCRKLIPCGERERGGQYHAGVRSRCRVPSVLDYTALIWASLLGFIFYSELPGAQVWVGGALIITACVLTAQSVPKPAPVGGYAAVRHASRSVKLGIGIQKKTQCRDPSFDIRAAQHVSGRNGDGLNPCAEITQRLLRGGQLSGRFILGSMDEHCTSFREVFPGRRRQDERGPKQHCPPDRLRVKHHGRRREIGAVRVADNDHLVGVEPVAFDRHLEKGGEGAGLGADVGLVEGGGRGSAEPAWDLLLGASTAHAQKGSSGSEPAGQRHQVGLVAARAV